MGSAADTKKWTAQPEVHFRSLTCCNLLAPNLRSAHPYCNGLFTHLGGGIMRFRAALLVGAFLAVVTSGTAFGQGFQGGLRGSVKDSGGVVPGVDVTLTNEATNISRSTVTNERGEYAFANVIPGTYSVKAALTGY